MKRKLSIRIMVTAAALTCSGIDALSRNASTRIPVLFDSTNSWHRDAQYHPEQPHRIDTCVKALVERCGSGVHLIDVADDSATAVDRSLTNKPFSQAELDHARAMLVEAHSEELVSRTEKRCRTSRQRRLEEGKSPLGFIGYIDYDTFLTTQSYDVCLRATAAWIRAVDLALDCPPGASMALTRPPGHHATKSLSNGFCLFNFAAAAAFHALQRHSELKVSILDWDVHYGQGVADIIQKHPHARYVSIHQTPAFPYLGESRTIQGEYNNILTIPILADTTWTCGYQDSFREHALPFVQDEAWQPDLVIVCAGYDALSSDELASVSLTALDYGKMTRFLLDWLGRKQSSPSQERKRPGLMLGLEGGYQLAEGAAGGNLADAVVETVSALLL